MNTSILGHSDHSILPFTSALPEHNIHLFTDAIELMKSLELESRDALIVPCHSDEVDVCDLMVAARAVSPGLVILTIGLPDSFDASLKLINIGRPDYILSETNTEQWHGQIARAVVQKEELKIALKENARLEKNNSQLEFHVRQFMLAEGGF